MRVEALPGPTAFVPALVASGLPCDRFVYEGFLPHKKGRQTRLKALAAEARTTVLYESPHRLVRLLTELAEHCGTDRPASVAPRALENIRGETAAGPSPSSPPTTARRRRSAARSRSSSAARTRNRRGRRRAGAARSSLRPPRPAAHAPRPPFRPAGHPAGVRAELLLPRCRQSPPTPADTLTAAEASVEATVATDGVHVVHFWAPWCDKLDVRARRRVVRGRGAASRRDVYLRDALERGRRRRADAHAVRDPRSASSASWCPARSPPKGERTTTFLGMPVTWIPTTWVFNRNGQLAVAFNYGEADARAARRRHRRRRVGLAALTGVPRSRGSSLARRSGRVRAVGSKHSGNASGRRVLTNRTRARYILLICTRRAWTPSGRRSSRKPLSSTDPRTQAPGRESETDPGRNPGGPSRPRVPVETALGRRARERLRGLSVSDLPDATPARAPAWDRRVTALSIASTVVPRSECRAVDLEPVQRLPHGLLAHRLRMRADRARCSVSPPPEPGGPRRRGRAYGVPLVALVLNAALTPLLYGALGALFPI